MRATIDHAPGMRCNLASTAAVGGVMRAMPVFNRDDKIVNQLNLSAARGLGSDSTRVNVDLPAWMVDYLDREARGLGVTRQSLMTRHFLKTFALTPER